MDEFSIIIPARYGSTRFKGKPLVKICGRPMIQHVYERALLSHVATDVIVATDNEQIFNEVKGFGGEVIMTSPRHKSGTERVAEVAGALDSEFIINIQADEPLIDPEVIRLLAGQMRSAPQDSMFSMMRPLNDEAEFINPDVVKVVLDHDSYALYFSRAQIPYPRIAFDKADEIMKSAFDSIDDNNMKSAILERDKPNRMGAYVHCGIYGYRREFLLRISAMRPSYLEYVESLEQLRILANGFRIKMVRTDYNSIGVDTPDDIKAVEAILCKMPQNP